VSVTGDQLAALLSQSAAAGLANPSPASPGTSLANPLPATPPVILINGDNPARINVGDAYGHALERIAAIERHLGITKKIAA
jgi:hypothetical protein